MRAFADGCSAITGVEAVSNGVPGVQAARVAERPDDADGHGRPRRRRCSWDCRTSPAWSARCPPQRRDRDLPDRRAVYGTGPIYYLFQLATTGILILAANTSSPTSRGSSSILARDGFMPSRFAFRGERLAFSAGIVVLAVVAIVVLVAFGGRVEALIPLYAIGVFTSITLSQAGWSSTGCATRRRLAAERLDQRRSARSRPRSSRRSSPSRSSPSAPG